MPDIFPDFVFVGHPAVLAGIMLVAGIASLELLFGSKGAFRRNQFIDASTRLIKLSLIVANRHPRLLIFPLAAVLLSMTSMVIASSLDGHGTISVTWPFHVRIVPDLVAHLKAVELSAIGAMVNALGMTFFGVALCHEILAVLANGRKVSLRRGMTFASQRIRSIVLWSLLAGVLKYGYTYSVHRVSGGISSEILGGLWSVWTIATIFILPLIVYHPSISPIGLLRRSGTLIQYALRESVLGFIGIYLVPGIVVCSLFVLLTSIGLLVLCCLIMGILASLIGGGVPGLNTQTLAEICMAPALIVSIGLLMAIENIWCCALYTYAAEGAVPEPYASDILDAVWKVERA